MTAAARIRDALVVAAVAAAGLGGVVASLSGHGADEAFLVRQENPTRLAARDVEKAMLSTPAPSAPHPKSATRAVCEPRGEREVRNPWRCVVDYPSDPGVPFRVTIRPDGSYVARYLEDDSARATGCCVDLPTDG